MCRKLTCFVALVLMLSVVLTSAAKGADPSLVGCWKFDENVGTTATDSSGHSNDGIIYGAT